MTAQVIVPYVLLADKSADTRQAFLSLFTQLGWKFDLLEDGKSIPEAAASKPYDLLITDIPMPGLQTAELLRAMRSASPKQAIVVVADNVEIASDAKSLKDSAIETVSRPIDGQTLSSSISKALRAVRKQSECSQARKYLTNEKYEYSFTSLQLANVPLPFALAETLERQGVIDTRTKLRLELAFQEALANSLEHGNLELESKWREVIDNSGEDKFSKLKNERLKDPQFGNRKINVRMKYQPGRLEVEISDEGKGFVVTKTPATLPQDQLQSSGRGRALIESTMDEVRYENGGRKIILIKNLGTDTK